MSAMPSGNASTCGYVGGSTSVSRYPQTRSYAANRSGDTATSRNIFHKNYIKRLLDDHMSERANDQTRLWALLMLELWFRMWVDQPAEAALMCPAA